MEIIAINANSERIGIESYLARKWGLVESLPSGHPCNKNPAIAVSSIGSNSATVSAELIDLGGASTVLSAHYGTLDGGTDTSAWQHDSNLSGFVSLGQSAIGLNGLDSNTSYFVRVKATNSAGSTWSNAFSFTTSSEPSPPTLSVSEPTMLGNTTATTKGNLLSFDSNASPTVTLYYGTSDGDQTASNWDDNVSLGNKEVGSLDFNLTGLTEGTTYYYRYFATVTISGTAYSSFSDLGTFTTLSPPTVQTLAVSPIFQTGATLNAKPTLSGNDTASITFYWGDNNGSNSGSHDDWDHNLTVSGTHNSGDVISHAITGLTTGTTYYAVAKVTNSLNTSAYGTVVSFKAADRTFTKHSIPGLVLWLDATDVDGNGNPDSLGDGSSISAWIDKSTKGVTVNQTNSGNQPVYKSASFGSKPAVRFDGIDDVLNLTPIRSTAGGYSVYVATRRHDTLGDTNAHIIDEAGWNLIADATNQPYSPKILSRPVASHATLTNLKIGKDAGGTANDFGGDIGEILIFDRRLSFSEEAKIFDHLAHKWGVPATTIFSPSTLPSLKLWLDAADSSTVFTSSTLSTLSTSSVGGWMDKSGHANHATQATSGEQPTFTSNGMSGKSGLNFNADKLSIPAINMDGKTLFAVIQPDTSRTQQILSHSSVNVQLRLNTTNQLQYASSSPLYNATPSTETIANNQISIVSFTLDNTLGFSINGTFQDSEVNKESSGSSIFNQIGTRQNSSERFDGKIGEIIIIDSVSSTDRQKIEGYLARKWGINLSSNQPIAYIDVPPLFDNTPKFVEKPYISGYTVDFSPSELTNLSYWLDAQDISTIAKDGSNKVEKWADKSGNDKNATRSNTSNQPTYVASDPVLNGKPSVKNSSGTGQRGLNIPTSSLREIFMVGYYNNGIDNNFNTYNTLFSGSSSTSYRYKFRGQSNTDYSNTSLSFDSSPNINGYAASATILPMPASVLRFKSSSDRDQITNLLHGANNQSWLGGIGEVIALSSLATSEEVRKIEGYLAHKWGTAHKLISSHPHYNRIDGEVGTSLSFQLEAIQGPETWSADGNLSNKGLSINSSTGLITGTPNAEGNFTTAITVANSGGSEQRNVFFNITKGTRVIDWNQTFAGITYGDSNFSLSATATGSNNLYFSSSDSSILEINGSTVEYPSVSNGLISWWRFDETSGSTASPSVGSYDGTLSSPASFGSGKFGNAVILTGETGNRATFPAAAGNLGRTFSVSLWVKWGDSDNDANWSRLITNKPSDNDATGWNIKGSNNNTSLRIRGTGTREANRPVTSDWKNLNWVHLVAAFENGMVSTYADGSFIGMDDINPVANSTNSLTLGSSVGGDNRWNGAVDDLRLYDRILTQSDVTTIYGGGNGDFVSVRTGNSVSIKKAGSVTLTAHAPALASMNAATLVNQTITVSKAPLTITGDSLTMNQGGSVPTLTYQISGYKYDDNETTALSTGISMSTDATTSSAAGNYYTRPGAATSDKYFINFVDGVLVVTSKTPQSITWGQDFSSVSINQFIDLNATADSGLPIVYSVDQPGVADLAVTNQSSLDAWWKMDESASSSSPSQAADSSGNGRTALLQGISGTSHWVTGKFGNALSLDGSDDYAYALNYKGITGNARRTIALWFKTSTAGNPILQYGASGAGTLFKLSLNSSGAAVLDLGGTSITSSSSGHADGNWHHLAVTIPANGNTEDAKIYVDGNPTSGSGSTAINTDNNNDLKIGTDGLNYFNGQIDDLRFYGAELNSTVIDQLYSNGNGDFNRLKIVSAGTVTVTANQPGNGTFAVAPALTSTITIGKSNQTIAFNPISDKSVGDFDFSPTAVASSGLPITFTSSDSLVAEVQGTVPNQTIKIRAAGTATITASQAGNGSFHPAPSVTQTVTVGHFNLQANSFPGIRLWVDANNVDGDTTADNLSNGSSVTQWIDQSGNTNHPGASTNKPTYTASGLNEKGILTFTQAQSMNITDDSGIRVIAAVLKQSASQTAATKPFGGDQTLTSMNQKFTLGAMDSGVSTTSFRVVVWQMSPGAYSLYVDGTNKGSSTSSLTPAAFDKVGNNFAGSIAEVIAYDDALSDGVRQKLEGYLAHKWGLVSNLPSTHAYAVDKPAFGGDQVLTFQPIPDKQAGQSVTLDVTSDSGLSAFTFDSNDSSVVSFSGNVATALKVGKVTITATQAGQAPWLSATASQPFIVTATPRVDQTITFTDIPNQTVQSANFNLSATASSGLPVSFAVISGNSATVESNGTVTIIGAGVTTIRASQDGNGSYNPAPTVEKTLTVNKVGQTITFGTLSNASLTAGTYALSATASSGLSVSFSSSDNTVAEVSGTTLTLKKGGSITITASQGGNGTYSAAPDVIQTLTVVDDTQQAQTITWTQALGTRAFGVADLDLNATTNSGLPITYLSSDSSVASIINSTYLKVIGAGTATITATQAGNGQYQAATSVAKDVTVSKANQVIVTHGGSTTLPDLTKDNGDFEFIPAIKSWNSEIEAETGLTLTYTSSNSAVIEVTGSGAKLTPKGAGSATITVSQAGDARYNAADSKTFNISVTEFSPYNDSFTDLTLWLDGKDINGDQLPETAGSFLANNKVSTWADRSGNGNTLTQSQTLNHPTYMSAGGGGLTFDGDDFLRADLPLELQGNPAMTILIVADSEIAGGRILQLGSNTGASNQVFGLHESGSVLYNDGNQTASQSFNPSPTLGVWRRSSGATKAETEFFRFGTSVYLSSPSTASALTLPSSSSDISLGNGHTGSGNDFFEGVIREVMIFSKALDNYNLQRMEGYLSHKWGSIASLPSDHLFKSDAPTFGGDQNITVGHTNLGTDASDNLPFMSVFDAPFKLEGSYASSGLTLTYETNDTSILTVNSQGLLQPVAPGKVQITLKQAGNSHFSAASPQTLDMKILGKRSQTITFASIPDKQPGDANFTITATASSGLPVTFTSEDNSTATVSPTGTRFR